MRRQVYMRRAGSLARVRAWTAGPAWRRRPTTATLRRCSRPRAVRAISRRLKSACGNEIGSASPPRALPYRRRPHDRGDGRMAISAVEYFLMRTLREQNLLPLGADLLQLGESNWYG